MRARDDLGNLLFHRLQVSADMTGDGRVTISDVMRWLEWLLLLPGDCAVLAMAGTPVGAFFEVDAYALGGGVAIGISAVFWVAVWLALFGSGRRK